MSQKKTTHSQKTKPLLPVMDENHLFDERRDNELMDADIDVNYHDPY